MIHQLPASLLSCTGILWLFNIAMETCPCIDGLWRFTYDFPIKNGEEFQFPKRSITKGAIIECFLEWFSFRKSSPEWFSPCFFPCFFSGPFPLNMVPAIHGSFRETSPQDVLPPAEFDRYLQRPYCDGGRRWSELWSGTGAEKKDFELEILFFFLYYIYVIYIYICDIMWSLCDQYTSLII